jgi:hypothetical protein
MAKKPSDVRAAQLSHDDVARLVGDVDDTVIASILATGASYAEIEQALKWLGPDAEGPSLDAHGLTPTAETRLRHPAFEHSVQRR